MRPKRRPQPDHASFDVYALACRRLFALAAISLLACSCQPMPKQGYTILGENDDYAVVHVSGPVTLGSLAQDFLGDRTLGWLISDQNGLNTPEIGETVVIPLRKRNVVGIQSGAYQTVPILSYHHFGNKKGQLSVTDNQFRAQLDYFNKAGFTVIPLSLVYGFLAGEQALPKHSVVITIDDGHRSAYDVAFPILKEYGFPATLFVYTDRIGKGGLTWSQMEEMKASGLIDVQPHSKSHLDMTVRLENESLQEYRNRVSSEVRAPRAKLQKNLHGPVDSFSYPYGATNAVVVDELRRNNYHMGLTVKRGGNAFFYHPYTLRRTMIYRDDGLDRFARLLQTSIPMPGN